MYPIFPFSARNRSMGAFLETAQRIVKILQRDEFDFNIALGGAPHGNQQALIDNEMSKITIVTFYTINTWFHRKASRWRF
jgi:hypothetical protein